MGVSSVHPALIVLLRRVYTLPVSSRVHDSGRFGIVGTATTDLDSPTKRVEWVWREFAIIKGDS